MAGIFVATYSVRVYERGTMDGFKALKFAKDRSVCDLVRETCSDLQNCQMKEGDPHLLRVSRLRTR